MKGEYEMEQLEKRYVPGRRENSFFMDMPIIEKNRKRASVASENIFEYTYYVDSDGSLIKEKLK